MLPFFDNLKEAIARFDLAIAANLPKFAMAIVKALLKPATIDVRKKSTSDSFGNYLRDIGRFPLLTHEQEIEYGRTIQAWMKVKESKRWDELDPDEKDRLQPLKRSGERAINRMVECNLRLVVSNAKRYQNRGLDLLELVQEGSIGLRRAAEKFDATKGYKFSTYATWWIRQALTRSISERSRSVRIPVHACEKLNLIKKTRETLLQETGTSPSKEQILNCIENRSKSDAISCRKLMENPSVWRTISLDQPISSKFGSSFMENDPLSSLVSGGIDPIDDAINREMVEQAHDLLSNLDDRHRLVLEMRYGIGYDEHSLEDVGAVLNVSRERVRQMQKRALFDLKKAVRAQLTICDINSKAISD